MLRNRFTNKPLDEEAAEQATTELAGDAAASESTAELAATAADETPAAEATTVEPGAGAHLFTIERVAGRPRITGLPVSTPKRRTVVPLDEHAERFDVDLLVATTAVATGNFAIAPDSRARLKE